MVRRPHAYDFLNGYPELLETMMKPGATPDEVVVDAALAPIPGAALIEPDGTLVGWVAFYGPEPREKLLELLALVPGS